MKILKVFVLMLVLIWTSVGCFSVQVKNTPPGQAKKTEKKVDKKVPPGQAKKR